MCLRVIGKQTESMLLWNLHASERRKTIINKQKKVNTFYTMSEVIRPKRKELERVFVALNRVIRVCDI